MVLQLRDLGRSDVCQFVTSIIFAAWCWIFWFEPDFFMKPVTPGELIDSATGILYLGFVFFFLSRHRIARFLLIPIGLLFAVSMPIRGMVGPLVTVPNIETLLGTSWSEATAVLLSMPWQMYLFSVLLASVFVGVILISKSTLIFTRAQKRLIAVILVLALPVFLSFSRLDTVLWYVAQTLCVKAQAAETTWKPTGVLPEATKAQNYVLVIGESQRRDAMGIYGSGWNTTPFLESVPVKLIERPVAPAGSTMQAVPLMLALKDEQGRPEAHNNVIQLAKAAGMETYWVSSQQRVTHLTTPMGIVAESSEHHFYAPNNDKAVLDEVARILRHPSDKPKLIVVHMYGLHEPVCARLADGHRAFSTGVKGKDFKLSMLASDDFFDCYLTGTLQTDRFLESIVRSLRAAQDPFKLIFTSDHGSAVYYKDDDLQCCRFPNMKSLYEVPFIELGSGILRSERFNLSRSTAKIADYFPTWIGVKTNKTKESYDIFSSPADKPTVFNMTGDVTDFDNLKGSISLSEMIKSAKQKNGEK